MMEDAYSVWPEVDRPRAASAEGWPRISIVTPNFNGSATLETTILSVLRQEYPSVDYIVLDDGSTDHSVEIIKRHQGGLAHWSSHPNIGQYATINKGFTLADGEIFAWLNSDDFYFPWTLRMVGDIFRSYPDIDWIMGQPCTTWRGAVCRVRPVRAYNRRLISWGLHYGRGLGVIQQESCFWRRSLWEKVGGLDTRWTRAADFELWTRFAQRAELVTTEALLGGFHRTGSNRSVVHADKYGHEVTEIKKVATARLPVRERRRRTRLERLLLLSERAGRAGSIVADLLWPRGLTGPVLEFDFQAGATRLTRRSVTIG